MLPVKIVIPGRFYDSFIYNKKLLLWNINGDIIQIDWDFLIEDFFENSENRFAYFCAFIHGDYLYGDRWRLIFEDPLVNKAIKHRFDRIKDVTFDIKKMNENLISICSNPFPFPHSDCIIYRKYKKNPDLYISTSEGLLKSPYYEHKNGNLFNTIKNSIKCHDIPSFNIDAQSDMIISSCGNDGVWGWSEVDDFNSVFDDLNLMRLSANHSTWINWSFSDIFSSSYYNGGYLLETSLNRENKNEQSFSIIKEFDANELFDKRGLTWGVGDKICSLRDGEISIYRYKRNIKNDEEKFTKLESFYDERISFSNIIKTGSAPWGYILEYRTMLLIIQSNGELIKIEHENQEIVNWRIFTRSVRYSNQLHVIFEDNISIYSFNNDYFQNQFEKNIGIRFIPNSSQGYYRMHRL